MNKFIGIFNHEKQDNFNLEYLEDFANVSKNEFEHVELPKLSLIFSKKCHNSYYFDQSTQVLVFVFGRISSINSNFDVNKEEVIKNKAEIIFNLYKSDKDNFIHKVIGSFCIQVFNFRESKVYTYKDHLGLRPFFYCNDANQFYFASEINLFFESRLAKKAINRKRVIHYITHTAGINNETFFSSIYRLPASAKLSFQRNKIETKKMNLIQFRKLNESLDQVKVGLRDRLINATLNMLPKDEKVASKLSGGLDSSSIGSILATYSKKNIKFMSGVYDFDSHDDFVKTDEKKYIDEFISMYKTDSSELVFRENDHIDPFKYDSKDDEPNFIMNRYFDIKFLKHLQKNDIHFVYDGFDGDSVITYGTNYFYDLGKKLNLKELFSLKKQLEDKGSIKKISNIKFFIRYVFLVHLPQPLKDTYNLIKRNKSREELNYQFLNKKIQKKYPIKNLNKEIGLLKTNYMHSKKIHKKVLDWPVWGLILEHNFFEANRYNVEELFPFMDRDVIEYSLNIDTKYKLMNGHKRYVLRASMENLLPSGILNRTKKSDLSPAIENFYSKLKKERRYYDLLTSDSSPLKGLLDNNEVAKIYDRNERRDNQTLHNMISLARWMQRQDFKWINR